MVSNLKKPGEDILAQWDAKKASASHMVVGFTDELFELWQALHNEDSENILEEAGDLLFYIKGLEQDLGLEPIDFTVPFEIKEGTPVFDPFIAVITPIKRHLYYNKPLDNAELQEALTVMASFAVDSAQREGSDLNSILEANYQKLAEARYKNGYSDKAAEERVDKA